jgi:hypothetical protein
MKKYTCSSLANIIRPHKTQMTNFLVCLAKSSKKMLFLLTEVDKMAPGDELNADTKEAPA